jgi:hypothetical protein
MAENKMVSFNLPSPYQAELAKIADQQRMAEMLQAQSQAPIERFSYKGIEARTPATAGLAKLLQGFGGAYFQGQGREQEKALGEEYRNRSQMEGRDFIGALRGTPEIPMPAEEQGGGPARPAQGPDMARALELSMNSVNPMVQGAGGALFGAMLPKASKWEKVELPTPEGGKRVGFVDMNSPNPEATFRLGGQQGPKAELVNIGGAMVPRTGFEQSPQPIARTLSPDTTATLEQAKSLADRAFNSLSASQQAQDRREAQRLGLSQQQYNLSKWQAENPSLSFHEGEAGPVAFNPKSGVAAPVMTPAGTPLLGGKPLTESQGKSTGFASRAGEADQILNTVGQGGEIKPSLIKAGAEAIPLIGGALGTAANIIAPSGPQQQVEQAQRNFVNAVLRQESGASISASEFANAQRQYFPQVGDSPEVIKQKAANRQTSINALKVQAGPGMQRMPQQATATAPMRAKNAQTGAEIVSIDGGVTWQPAGR